jgi:aldehyde dehydrogenase (NAD+)
MVHSPVLRAISFTGSNEVGGALYAKAAQRGAKVTCEMGGKNAVIVMADADLDKAAIAIHGGAFGSTGQRCTATSRVIASSETSTGSLGGEWRASRSIRSAKRSAPRIR